MKRLALAVLAASIPLSACGDDALGGADADGEVDVFLPDVVVDTFDTLDTLDTHDTLDTVDTRDTADTTPADTTPQDTADTRDTSDTTPADTTPADTTPADTTPADTTPADTTPADTTPADTTPQDTADTRDTADTVPQDTQDTAEVDTTPQQCPADETVVTRSTIYRQQNFSGASNAVKFTTDLCSDAPDSAERGYRFELTSETEIYAATDCGWDCELVLTRGGCTDQDVMACETSLGDEAFGQSYIPGTYHLFVEGDNPEDPGPYDLMVNINRTGGQAQCVATALDVVNAANCNDPTFGNPRYELTTSGSTSAADGDDFFVQDVDGCTHDGDHIGGAPDKVYSFTLPGTRDVEISLSPDSWDALLYVTGSPCGAAAQVQGCSDGAIGSGESLSLSLGAGTWYIVVDGFGEEVFSDNASGPFDLEVLVFDDACNE